MLEFNIDGRYLKSEIDRMNMCELAAKILDVQADDKMLKLTVDSFNNKEEK